MSALKDLITVITLVFFAGGLSSTLLPNNSLQKYIRFISGLMVVICISTAFSSGFKSSDFLPEIKKINFKETAYNQVYDERLFENILNDALNDELKSSIDAVLTENFGITSQSVTAAVNTKNPQLEIDTLTVRLRQSPESEEVRKSVENYLTVNLKMRVRVII